MTLSLIEIAIKAASVADPHFTMNRRPKLAGRCRAFLEVNPAAGAEALYIFAQQTPAFAEAKPETRVAFEIFRATILILTRAEDDERASALRQTKSRAVPAPAWMRDDGEQEAPGMNELISALPHPVRSVPAPVHSLLSSEPKLKAKKKA